MKFATIGTSWITELFIETTNYANSAQLHAVYSRKTETAAAFAKKHQAAHFYTDLDAMLEEPLDFVYIASPNSLHFEQALKCLEKGKHVFCEKPMTYTEAQLERLAEAAQEHDVFIFEGYRHLYSPNFKVLEEAMSRVGTVRNVFLQYIQYSSKYDAVRAGETPNVFTREFAGGALMDLGVYPLSTAIALFGEPTTTQYFPVLLENGIDISGTLVLTYDGFNVTILCSKAAQATIASEINGEDGSLTIDQVSPLKSLSFYDHRTEEREDLSVPTEALDMIYELTTFINMIKAKDVATYERALERSRQIVRCSEAARKSAGILFPGE